MDFVINVLSIILGFAAATIPVFVEVKKKGKKRPNQVGVVVIIIISIVIGLQIWQIILARNERVLSAQRELLRDSLAEAKIEQRDSINLANFGHGLAKYYLRYDSTTKEIRKLVKDSMVTTVVQNSAISPALDFAIRQDSISNGKIHLSLTMIAYEATAENIHIRCYVAYESSNKWLLDKGIESLFDNGYTLVKNHTMTAPLIVQDMKIKSRYFLLKGNYADKSGKSYQHNQIIAFDFHNQKFGIPNSKLYPALKNFFSEKGLM